MTSKRKRHAQKIIDCLKEPAPMSNNKGRYIRDFPRARSEKDRRHEGWSTPKIHKPGMKWVEITEEGIEPQEEYDEWSTKRDGMHAGPYELERMTNPEKVKKQIEIRKVRKFLKEESENKEKEK